MKGRDRNSLCWCGSKKKYKKCHLGRENQERESISVFLNTNKKSFNIKKCCANNVGLGECSGKIIKAHTVSRRPNLSRIAEKSCVLCYGIDDIRKSEMSGRLTIKSLGIGNASTFFGFCLKHDRELFSIFENEAFIGKPKQCLAHAYRTLSRELYGKEASTHLRETLRGADKGMSIQDQIIYQKALDEIEIGNEAARREFKATHDTLTKALANREYYVLKSYILEFTSSLPFMFSGAWSPFTDLYDKTLQSGESDENLSQIFFSSFSENNSAMICISWLDTENAPGKVITDQILALPASIQASACIQIVVKHVENVFFNPKWFNDLTRPQRVKLDALAASGLDFMGSIPSEPIQLKLELNLPISNGFFIV